MTIPSTSPNTSLAARGVRQAVGRLIRSALRSNFRAVRWVGVWPPALPVRRPAVLYANHHSFYDGYLLWWLATQHLRRPPLVWMEEMDRIPLFAPLGTLPFPQDDARRRAQTVRETARRMRAHPDAVLFLFPEGEQRPPDAGLGPFSSDDLARISRLLPDAVWWPVGLRATWWGADKPEALLAGGAWHEAPDGDERERLEALVARLKAAAPPPEARRVTAAGDGAAIRTLLDGRRSPAERWDLSALGPLLARLG